MIATTVFSGIFSFGFVLGVVGNLIIIMATTKYKNLQIPTNVFVCNLCGLDIFTLLVGVPLFLLDRNFELFGKTKRIIFEPLRAILVIANVFTLVLIAIERNLVIIYPKMMAGTRSLKKSILTCMAVDFFSIVLGVTMYFSQKSNGSACFKMMFHVLFSFIVQCVVPLIIMSFLYFQTWSRIRSLNRESIKCFNRNRPSILEKTSLFESLDKRFLYNQQKKPKNNRKNSDLSDFKHFSNKKRIVRRSISFSGIHKLEYTEKSETNFSLTDLHNSFKHLNNNLDDNFNISRPEKAGTCQLFQTYEISNRRNGIFINQHMCDEQSSLQKSVSQKKFGDINLSSSKFNMQDYAIRSSMQKIRKNCRALLAGADLREITERFTMTRYKQTLKTLKVFGILLLFFTFCMLPFHVIEILNLLKKPVNFHISSLSKSLIYFHAFANPWLYGGLTENFQFAFKRLFQMKR
ncbi:alpha-1B adrenergic receptor-like isoform X2 [Hydra vulgaris]|uniref:Alpha-1B adrenergic receptor-like isoform X2 n=1 Tax=Hydra vulgaris TaxID=6087 RepID=A0ABM4DAS1_HYDVU